MINTRSIVTARQRFTSNNNRNIQRAVATKRSWKKTSKMLDSKYVGGDFSGDPRYYGCSSWEENNHLTILEDSLHNKPSQINILYDKKFVQYTSLEFLVVSNVYMWVTLVQRKW